MGTLRLSSLVLSWRNERGVENRAESSIVCPGSDQLLIISHYGCLDANWLLFTFGPQSWKCENACYETAYQWRSPWDHVTALRYHWLWLTSSAVADSGFFQGSEFQLAIFYRNVIQSSLCTVATLDKSPELETKAWTSTFRLCFLEKYTSLCTIVSWRKQAFSIIPIIHS